jgi:hypothetical protein
LTTNRWPSRALAAVPGEHIALRLADEIRQLAADEQSPCDLDQLCAIGGFRYRSAVLDAGIGGHEALLVPRVEGGFEILVDPSPKIDSKQPQQRVWRRRVRFRIAHEIGHSFFYDRKCRPARRLLANSEAEETFCDAFANALLVPPTVVARLPATPKSIVDLADNFDVSVEAAGRAFVKSKPGMSVLGLRPVLKGNAIEGFVVLWSAGPSSFFVGAPLGSRWARLANDRGAEDESMDRHAEETTNVRLSKLGHNYFLALFSDCSAAPPAR